MSSQSRPPGRNPSSWRCCTAPGLAVAPGCLCSGTSAPTTTKQARPLLLLIPRRARDMDRRCILFVSSPTRSPVSATVSRRTCRVVTTMVSELALDGGYDDRWFVCWNLLSSRLCRIPLQTWSNKGCVAVVGCCVYFVCLCLSVLLCWKHNDLLLSKSNRYAGLFSFQLFFDYMCSMDLLCIVVLMLCDPVDTLQ